MKIVKIYQTLEDRHDDEAIEKHGPFFCSEKDEQGFQKKGVKEPWLGEGYYFWDSRISNAKWWGNVVYKKMGYIVCCSTYDQHSEFLFDMVGVVEHFDEFVNCARYILEQKKLKYISFSVVLTYLKEHCNFNYRAIRVRPKPQYESLIDGIKFPKDDIGLAKLDKIQICFFDKTLFRGPYQIVYKESSFDNQTI